jgi:GDP-D-mannose 3', 5'-epimerase
MEITIVGAGGMIGSALTKRLLNDGHTVRALDIKAFDEWWNIPSDNSYELIDLRDPESCAFACGQSDWVFDLAADMGGVYFLEHNRADCLRSALIIIHMLDAAVKSNVQRFFYSSSACVYNTDLQTREDGSALREIDAWPAQPEPAYGDEKLFGEIACRWWSHDYGLETRVARYHNVYGFGTWQPPRAKAPAQLCAKVAQAVISGNNEIEIWGDGNQSRSFCWIDDCIEGTLRLMNSDYSQPLNIGSSELVTINQLVDILEGIAGVKLKRKYILDAPTGVRGRNSDNRLCREILDWEPSTFLHIGLKTLYSWVFNQIKE